MTTNNEPSATAESGELAELIRYLNAAANDLEAGRQTRVTVTGLRKAAVLLAAHRRQVF